MQLRFRAWHLAILLIVGCIALVWGLIYSHQRANSSLKALLPRFPEGEATIAHIDVTALRSEGLLRLIGQADVAQESEYVRFVKSSGFDYTEDLDSVLLGLYESETFLLLQGRFDWHKLVKYVEGRGGTCYNGLCRTRASTPTRHISFFAVTPSTMAMGVSRDPWAADVLKVIRENPQLTEIPEAPVWITLPGSSLRNSEWLPVGTQSFVSAVAGAERITFAVGRDPDGVEARLSVNCRTPSEAEQLASQLTSVTETLRKMIRLEHKEPDKSDLSGVLTGGSFAHVGAQMEGRWPVPEEFLRSVIEGAD